MGQEWYYLNSKNEIQGPLTSLELKQCAADSRLLRNSKVRLGPNGEWRTASTIKGLFLSNTVPKRAPLASDPDDNPQFETSSNSLQNNRTTTIKAVIGGGIITSIAVLVVVGFWLFGANSTPLEANRDGSTPRAEIQNEISHNSPEKGETNLKKANADQIESSLFSKPEEVVTAYLKATTHWRDRLPFVQADRQDEIRMERFYGNNAIPQLLPGTILSVNTHDIRVGETCTVTVDASQSSPDKPHYHYLVVKTEDGFRIKWGESLDKELKERELMSKQSLLKEIEILKPVIDSELMSLEVSSEDTKATVRLTNRSTKTISYLEVTGKAFDSLDGLIGHYFTNDSNIRSGHSVVKTLYIDNVRISEIESFKMSINKMLVEDGDGKQKDMTEHFEINDQLAGADRNYKIKLEASLNGHWSESKAMPLLGVKSEFFFSGQADTMTRVNKREKVRYRTEVLKRNYSAGLLTIRMLSDGSDFGMQYDITLPKSGNDCKARLTHLSVDDSGFRSLANDIQFINTNEWYFLDQNGTP